MPNAAQIPVLRLLLASQTSTATVFNPYTSTAALNNLEAYLHALLALPFAPDLLVGEAPGYAGCARTGIPFTSEGVIATSPNTFIASLRPRLACHGSRTENTATMVWDCISSGSKLPAFWNAFPFHPHPTGQPSENRRPNNKEIQGGANVLGVVLQILDPARVFAIGRAAEKSLTKNFPHLAAPYIRHPSRGGLKQFQAGLLAHHII